MKIKELIEDLKNYNPELDIELAYPLKDSTEFYPLKNKGLFKGIDGKYFIELKHSENGFFKLIEEIKEEVDE